ncbi:DNA polymerase III subunit beta [Dictyobacter arantiisoli]|uniref:Beta sliding clamp n=1 Tax=Dictyobacter arantiisoli TaxID=2014874 RepID=A0A5A5TE37_9CHLR|nr:DNA polymerase III subunit beta [Dictyobacter arantiisoli]GCF09269.1 DNA polymerase III subunit beta [Dictyobacter arantiisoli]
MKIKCKQQDLSRGLSTVSHAVSSRSTLPILANILLSTEQGSLKLSATNLEIGINCLIDAEIIENGTTTVPAKTFIDLVSSLRQDQVELTVAEDSYDVNVKSPGSNANIKGMDPSEFPLIPSAEGDEEPILLDANLLKDMIAQVVFAAADDDSRPVLTGVLVEVANEQVSFAAADAFRLALRVSGLPGHVSSHSSILIPARTLSELARILPSEGAVQMVVTPNRSQVLFHTEHVDLVSRLIEGTFPNIKAAIPREHATRAVIETKEFAAAVKRVTPFARDSSNITRIKISSGGDGVEAGSLTLEATAEDIGNNVTTINAAVDGPDQEIIFNVRYLTDVLSILDTPEVALEVTSAARPGVVKPVSAADYTYVIMPMSTNR